jgi:peptidoglycan biosynthesis protein MviN/MurJ (putative lipid II flippase)
MSFFLVPRSGRESLRWGLLSTVGLNLCIRSVTFFQGLILASLLGVSREVDLFFYIINTALLVSGFLRAVNSAVLIPRFFVVERQYGKAAAVEFFNHFLLLAGALCALLVLASVFVPDRVWAAASGFQPEFVASHRMMFHLAMVFLLGTLIVGFLTDLLSACQVFTLPLLAALPAAVLPLVFLVVDRGRHGVGPLIIGSVGGSIFSVICLGFLAFKLVGWRPWQVRRVPALRVWGDIGFAQAGNVFTAGAAYLLLFFLNGLGEGVVAAASYARMLANIPRALLVEHVTSFLGLKFNQAMAQNDWAEINRVFYRLIVVICFFLWPVCLFVCLCRQEIVALLFVQRQVSPGVMPFNLVADLLAFQAMILPFETMHNFINRVYISAQKIVAVFSVQVFVNTAIVALAYLLKNFLGVLAYGHAQLWPLVVLVVLLHAVVAHSIVQRLDYFRSLVSFLSMGGAFGIAAVLSWLIIEATGLSTFAKVGLVFSLLTLAGAALFASPLCIEVRRASEMAFSRICAWLNLRPPSAPF